MALDFDLYARQGNTFLKDYAKAMNLGDDTGRAGRIFQAIMHALRDIIPTEESLQFLAQLPMFLKAAYVNGWRIRKNKPRVKSIPDFLKLVREHDWPASPNDFEYSDDVTERYVKTTFIYLRKHISLGEMEDIRDNLPKDLRNLVYSNLMFS